MADTKLCLEEINKWKGQVDWVLNYDYYTATIATYGIVRDTAGETKRLVTEGKGIKEKLLKL